MRAVCAILLFLFLVHFASKGNKVMNSGLCNEAAFKDSIESMLPKLPDRRLKELAQWKRESSGLGYVCGAVDYSLRHSSSFDNGNHLIKLKVDSMLDAAMYYAAVREEWSDMFAPVLIYEYSNRLYERGYNRMSGFWANIGVQICRKLNNGGLVYGKLRSLESVLEVDSLPQQSLRTQIAMLGGFEQKHKEDSSIFGDALAYQYLRTVQTALRAGDYVKADSLKEVALDYLLDRKNPDIISGKISIIAETDRWMFQWKGIESELLLHQGKIDEALDISESLLWRYYENNVCGNLNDEDFPYYFKAIELLASHGRFDNDNFEHLIPASEYVRDYLYRIIPSLSPALRNKFYEDGRRVMKLINSCLLKFTDKEDVRGTIYNNILLFKGLNLITDRSLNLSDANVIEMIREESLRDNPLYRLIDLQYHILTDDAVKLNNSDFSSWIFADWEKIAGSLPENGISVEFFKNEENGVSEYYAAVIRGERDKSGKFCEPEIIKISDENSLRALLNSRRSFFNTTAYDEIWGKILTRKRRERSDRKVNNIYFSADGILNAMAIEYLPASSEESGKTLFDKYDVYRLSSTKNLVRENAAKPQAEAESMQATLFGDITFSGESVDTSHRGLFDNFTGALNATQLPGTKGEILGIDSLLRSHNWNVSLYTGSDVTKNEILRKRSNATIEHIASHGFYIADTITANNPHIKSLPFLRWNATNERSSLSRSGILISNANLLDELSSDGIVTGYDISRSDKSNVDLLVLSLCRSGLGDIKDDGVYGLQRAYKIAGVKSMLISLWDVDDKASMILMQEFYKNYVNGLSKRESLRAAQKAVREFDCSNMDISGDFSAPRYWAGFILLDGI